MDLIRAFSERFNELIVYAGTSPKKMSAELKHNIHDIYHWKSGTARFMPSLKNIIKLADYFNCSISAFNSKRCLKKKEAIYTDFPFRRAAKTQALITTG